MENKRLEREANEITYIIEDLVSTIENSEKDVKLSKSKNEELETIIEEQNKRIRDLIK